MFVGVGCLLATLSVAAPPSRNDYASGMTVEAAYTQPMIETVLPDDVYRVVTREDLEKPEVQQQLNPDLKQYLN